MTSLAEAYQRRFESALVPVAKALKHHLQDLFGREARIDRITARPKSVDRFLVKAETAIDGKKKYSQPMQEIQERESSRFIRRMLIASKPWL
jgi:putative GTP pyrophosphokinase